MSDGGAGLATFDHAYAWLSADSMPNLLLGNGFSVAYDKDRFSYDALATRADEMHGLPDLAKSIMAAYETTDFELVMRTLQHAADTLRVVDAQGQAALISRLLDAVAEIRESLARSIAGLHPDRPFDISEDAYLATRRFLAKFKSIYTASYDLLLYWSLMQDLPLHHLPTRASDDGFRDSGNAGEETVLWDQYDPHGQNIHYLHGALHLFISDDGLRKITWSRTSEALIDQVRRQLAGDRFPLYVAEGESTEKLSRINRSGYLSRSLRSLANCRTPLLIYGHSLDENDDHILQAIVRSKVTKLAVSVYGAATDEASLRLHERANGLSARRVIRNPRAGALEVRFFDASTAKLWA